MTLIRFALGNLYHRPARTALTVSAIALGIAAMVALTSIAWDSKPAGRKRTTRAAPT